MLLGAVCGYNDGNIVDWIKDVIFKKHRTFRLLLLLPSLVLL